MARAEKDDHFKTVRDAALEQGWLVELTSKQHWKLTPPTKGLSPVFYSGTPGDWRAIKNFVAAMRQRGIRMPRR